MANSDKNISIIPNRSLTGQPQIIFTGQGNDPITLKVLDSTIGSLSFEGSAGQLLSITDSLSSGSIFSVNDISGIPSIDVNADGTVALAPFSGNIAIGVTSASFKLHVNGTLYAASAATFNSNIILSNGNLQTTTSTFNLITNTASIINIGTTSGSTISIASTTGTTTVNNSAIITGNLTVNGGTITSTATTFNLLNTTVTNANVLGAADTILIGSAGGSTTIRNTATRVNGTLTVTGVSVHQGAGAFNSTLSVTGTSTLIGDVTASGDLAVNGGDITSTATTFNLLNATVTGLNVGGAANTVLLGGTGGTTTIRNAGTNINGTLTVTGVSVHQGAGAFNSTLTVTGATVVQGALSANGALSVTGTSTLIGDVTASGDLVVNGGDITSTATTFNLLNTTVTGLNVGGAANTVVLGGTGGTSTIRNAGTNINGTLTVTGVSVHQGAGVFNSTLSVTGVTTLQGASTLQGAVNMNSTLTVTGVSVHQGAGTFNSTLSVTGVTTLQGASTLQGAVNMNSTLTVTGVSVHQGAGAFNSTLSVTGTSTLIGDVTASGDIAVNGGDITSTATTFNLLNTTVTNANVLGAANIVVIGGTGGAATIRNAGTNINGTLTVTGASTFIGDIIVRSGDIETTSSVFTFVTNTASTINIGTISGSTIAIGNASGTTTIRNAGTNLNGTLTVTGATVVQGALSTNSTLSVTSNAIFVGSILANGGTVTSTATTFNLLNTTVTDANVLGAATRVVIGANSSGTALIRNSTILLGGTVTGTTTIRTTTGSTSHLAISPQGNLYLAPSLATLGLGSVTELVVTNGQNATGQVQITGGDLYLGTKFVDELDPSPVNIIFEGRTDNANDTTLTVIDPTASRTISLPDASGVVAITTNGSLSVTGEATFAGSVIANGGTITSSATTFNLLNTTVTNANVLGAANTVVIGGTGGSTTIRNASTNINGTLTVSGNATFLGSALYTDTILAIGNQINIANAAGGRIAFGDYDGAGNSTYVFIRDATSSLLISNPYGNVGIGDPNNVDSGYALLYNAAAGYLDGGNSTLTNFGTGSFNGLLTASAGISVSGATAAIFNGTVSCNSNTIYKPTLQYYNEVLASPTISANVLTLDLSTAQMFTVSLNANITTFTISNTPATANRSIGFTLIFTADGTARTVTWGSAVKWANNDPPALTSANGKKDILSFVSPDGGTNWYGFIGGLNF